MCIYDKPQIRYFKSTCEKGTGLELDHGLNSREIKVYPVPAGNKVFIEWPPNINLAKHLEIYDVWGVLVQKINIDLQGMNRGELDIHDLSSGVYLINLNTGGKMYTGKLVKI